MSLVRNYRLAFLEDDVSLLRCVGSGEQALSELAWPYSEVFIAQQMLPTKRGSENCAASTWPSPGRAATLYRLQTTLESDLSINHKAEHLTGGD